MGCQPDVQQTRPTRSGAAAGRAGGLFIPLVIQGALVGRVVGGAFDVETTTLFPVVGMAAFLGAGYRVRDIMRDDIPVAAMNWVLGEAIRAIEDSAVDRIAVCDNGTFIGVITAADLVRARRGHRPDRPAARRRTVSERKMAGAPLFWLS